MKKHRILSSVTPQLNRLR